jgi:hypothetical protein
MLRRIAMTVVLVLVSLLAVGPAFADAKVYSAAGCAPLGNDEIHFFDGNVVNLQSIPQSTICPVINDNERVGIGRAHVSVLGPGVWCYFARQSWTWSGDLVYSNVVTSTASGFQTLRFGSLPRFDYLDSYVLRCTLAPGTMLESYKIEERK